jgi:hypothetical protein
MKISEILFILFLIIFYLVVVMPIRQWNCDRHNMDADLFTSGCIVREENENILR